MPKRWITAGTESNREEAAKEKAWRRNVEENEKLKPSEKKKLRELATEARTASPKRQAEISSEITRIRERTAEPGLKINKPLGPTDAAKSTGKAALGINREAWEKGAEGLAKGAHWTKENPDKVRDAGKAVMAAGKEAGDIVSREGGKMLQKGAELSGKAGQWTSEKLGRVLAAPFYASTPITMSKPVPVEQVRKEQAEEKAAADKKKAEQEEAEAKQMAAWKAMQGGNRSLVHPKGADYDGALKDLREQVEQLAKEEPEAKDFAAMLAKVQEDYKANEDNLAMRETIERVIGGLGQMAAGLYGLKTGLAIGPIDVHESDWEAKHDRALRRYQTEIDRVQADKQAQDAKMERHAQRKARLQEGITNLQTRAQEAEANRRFKIWDTEMRAQTANHQAMLKSIAGGGDVNNKQLKFMHKELTDRNKNLQKALEALRKGNNREAIGFASQGGLPGLEDASDWGALDFFGEEPDVLIQRLIDRNEAIKIVYSRRLGNIPDPSTEEE